MEKRSYLYHFVDRMLEEFFHHRHFNPQHTMRDPLDAFVSIFVDGHANIFAFVPSIKVNEGERQSNVQGS